MFRATEGLGLGMGGMQGTCGALAGACVVAGLAGSDGNLEHPASKRATYGVSRELVKRFQEAAGATRCGEIKGVGTGHMLMSCPNCVVTAAQLVEDVVLQSSHGDL